MLVTLSILGVPGKIMMDVMDTAVGLADNENRVLVTSVGYHALASLAFLNADYPKDRCQARTTNSHEEACTANSQEDEGGD
jgi:hypothetical protein